MKLAVFSYCLSVEFFWDLKRLLAKGFLFNIFSQNTIFHYVIALCASGLLFAFIHFITPRIYRGLRTKHLISTVILVFVASFTYAAAGNPPVSQDKRSNIILIIIDTLRADHLGCYGYEKSKTFAIDRFAQESLVFTTAYAAASWTLPSIASMLTGTFPGFHGAHRVDTQENLFSSSKLSPDNITLAEVLSNHGYQTASIVSSDFLGRQFGLDQGFQYIDDLILNYFYIFHAFSCIEFLNFFFPIQDYLWSKGFMGHRVADQINSLALKWLRNREEKTPFFLLIHYFDPHDPYIPVKLGASSKNVPDPIHIRYGRYSANYTDVEKVLIASVINNSKPLFHDEKELLIRNYDLEIERVDQKIAAIFEELKKMNIYDSSIIIIVSDHGESFGEHNLMLHGLSLYEDNIRVPLIIKFPVSDKKTGYMNKAVSLTGLMPTILSYLNIPIPNTVQGISFFDEREQILIAQNFRDPTWKNHNTTKRFDQDLISLIVGKHKIISSIGGKSELFDLELDPFEKNNLFDTNSDLRNLLIEHLDQHIKTLNLLQDNTKKVQTDVDQATIQKLRTLGYMK